MRNLTCDEYHYSYFGSSYINVTDIRRQNMADAQKSTSGPNRR